MSKLRLSIDAIEPNGDVVTKTMDYDPDAMTLWEAMDVEKFAGMTVTEFTDGLSRGRALSTVTLLWLARRANGEPKLKFSEVNGLVASIVVQNLDAEGNVVGDEDADPPTTATAKKKATSSA